eukprot:Amastigsp_a677587_13.p2 type:complete len:182 gc:universal Amastigsp_a677587_13:879-334(-)
MFGFSSCGDCHLSSPLPRQREQGRAAHRLNRRSRPSPSHRPSRRRRSSRPRRSRSPRRSRELSLLWPATRRAARRAPAWTEPRAQSKDSEPPSAAARVRRHSSRSPRLRRPQRLRPRQQRRPAAAQRVPPRPQCTTRARTAQAQDQCAARPQAMSPEKQAPRSPPPCSCFSLLCPCLSWPL